jgi:hypothetical protein
MITHHYYERKAMPEILECDQCGQTTHDDTSEVWEDVYSDGALRRICYDCAPPDQESF